MWRYVLLAVNLWFAIFLLDIDKGTAIINLACAIILAIDITMRNNLKEYT
jgi:hypothetical protein